VAPSINFSGSLGHYHFVLLPAKYLQVRHVSIRLQISLYIYPQRNEI
jgi:hypothetical protein